MRSMGQEGKGPVIRANIKVRGIVQGVGFRPFIHRQVSGYGLKGWVRNTSDGAEIEVEGPEGLIDRFAEELWTKKPLLALIEDVRIDKKEVLKGNLHPDVYASVYDIVYWFNNNKSYYGRQLSFDPETGKHFCVEIEDVSNVDKRRAEIGLPSVRVFCKKYNITPPANY